MPSSEHFFLGIETSCDETAVALLRGMRTVECSLVSSQVARHAVFGGVVPEIAAREHLKAIGPLYETLLEQTGVFPEQLSAIAVTQGPGLIGALLVGVSFAKGLATALQRPLIPVNHVHSHIYGALLDIDKDEAELFPALALVVSGGHTHLYLMQHALDFQLLGNAIDDACGECFDKVAKLLGFPYPGGPHIEKWAEKGQSGIYKMPRMLEGQQRLEFSYSGLKTHMVNLIRKQQTWTDQQKASLCADFQEEALGQLVRRVGQVVKEKAWVRSLVVAGGVSANKRFRELIADEISITTHFPSLKYCSDNAAMVAALGARQFLATPIAASEASLAWEPYSRYRKGDCHH